MQSKPFTFLACFIAATASAQDVRLRGESRASQFLLPDGYKVETFVRLQSKGAGLRFSDSPEASATTIVMTGGGGCEVRLEDRDADGRFETERTTLNGKANGRCLPVDADYARTALEAGADIDGLRDCRFETTDSYSVVCQPTRFGRGEGEAWTILEGFRDRYGRSATGRPDDLAWSGGLLVLDDANGLIFRIVESDEGRVSGKEGGSGSRPTAPIGLEVTNPPPPPKLMRGSAMGSETLSRERKAIAEKRRDMFGRDDGIQRDAAGKVID